LTIKDEAGQGLFDAAARFALTDKLSLSAYPAPNGELMIPFLKADTKVSVTAPGRDHGGECDQRSGGDPFSPGLGALRDFRRGGLVDPLQSAIPRDQGNAESDDLGPEDPRPRFSRSVAFRTRRF